MLFAVFAPQTAVCAEEQLCISQIKIESGDEAAEKLESGGYTVLFQNLNPAGGKRIYLGYKLGTNAITDLVVSSELKTSLSVASVNYTPVSSLNLNQGTKGKPVYLYSTTDMKAGSGIVSLDYVKDNKDDSVNLLEKFGDGSVPVRTTDGSAADFDEGIDRRDLYFFAVHKNSCMPYVSDMKIVNVSSGENAFKKIVASGCNYFNSEPVVRTNGTDSYLCYNRTADASQAVRYAAVSESSEIDGITYTGAGSFNLNGESVNLYYTKDNAVGNPVTEVTKGKLTNDSFTLGDWAKAYFSRTSSSAMSNIYGEDLYSRLIESNEEYAQLKIKNYKNSSDTDLYMILSAKGLSDDGTEKNVFTLPEKEQNENAEMQRDTEIAGIEKEESTTQNPDNTGNAVNAYGSVIGSGSLFAITVCGILAVAAAFILLIVKKQKNDKI